MRVGIHPALKPYDGGIYQYTASFLEALRSWSDGEHHADRPCRDDFVVFAHHPGHAALAPLRGPRWTITTFRPPWMPEASPGTAACLDLDTPNTQPDMQQWMHECGVELMIYPSPHRLSFEAGVPYVMAIHDLQHLLQPEFPEVSADGEWKRREYLFRHGARNATMLLADSETGKEDILNAYGAVGVTTDRVGVLPFVPGVSVVLAKAQADVDLVRDKYALSGRYLFYPAQFWPHKNHVRLIEALGLARSQWDLTIPIVLTGSADGALREQTRADVFDVARQHGIENEVRHLGYVSDDDLAALYAGAEALAMPTFFGPTNLPVLEAWSYACPVLTSDIRGIREQVGRAGVLVDPRSVPAIADGIRRLWTDEALRARLVRAGTVELQRFGADEFRCKLVEILTEAKSRLGTAAAALGRE